MKKVAVDLFSGCGGLSLGLERAGFIVKAAVEIDPLAVSTYRKNHPRTKVLEADIKKLKAKDILSAAGVKKGELDLLAGCPPCQGFSTITRKNKIDSRDPRNDLVLNYLKLALRIRPKVVLLENVPGLSKNWRFKKMIRALRRAKYDVAWNILNAADFGVPQRRKRLIMIASRIGKIGLPQANGGTHRTVKQTIGKMEHPIGSRDPVHQLFMHNTPRIKKIIALIPKNGGSRTALPKKYLLACHRNTQGFKDVYGRMAWNDVSPTLTSGCYNPSKGRFIHPSQNRPITVREAAMLQSFPRTYFFPSNAGLEAVARLIGDALPPSFAKKQAQFIYRELLAAT